MQNPRGSRPSIAASARAGDMNATLWLPSRRRRDNAPPDRLIGDDNPALCEQVFHVTETEREPQVQPNRVLNDLRREPVTRVADLSREGRRNLSEV